LPDAALTLRQANVRIDSLEPSRMPLSPLLDLVIIQRLCEQSKQGVGRTITGDDLLTNQERNS
jgi:hypothetical protein